MWTPQGKIETVVADARKTIFDIGLPWFERLNNPEEILRTLLEDSPSHETAFGFGANPSPIRNFMTGFTALSLGKMELARERIKEALESGCLKELEPKIHATLLEIDKK